MRLIDQGWYTGGTPTLTFSGTGGSGASWSLTYQDGGGTAAVTIGTAGKLTVATGNTLVLRGTLVYGVEYGNVSEFLVQQPGSTIQAEGTVIYAIQASGNGAYRTYTASCASSPCYLQATIAVTTVDAAYTGGPILAWDNLRTSKVGDAYVPLAKLDLENPRVSLNVQNCRFDNSGRFDQVGVYSVDGARDLIYRYNVHSNSPGLSLWEFNMTNTKSTGTWDVMGNVFDKSVGINKSGANPNWRHIVFTGNYFGGKVAPYSESAHWGEFTGNFIQHTIAEPSFMFQPQGSVTNGIYFIDVETLGNPHWITTNVNGTMTIDGTIFANAARNNGDSGEVVAAPNTNALTMQNAIVLPNVELKGVQAIISLMNYSGHFNLLHTTFFGGMGDAGTFPWGAIQPDETSLTPAGAVTMKSNILWSNVNTRPFAKIMGTNQATPTENVCSAGECDYNAGYNHTVTYPNCANCTNQGKGYIGKWSSTSIYGQNDVDGVNPNFVDWTRRVETFDQGFLGQAVGTAWSGGGTYALGAIVSNSNANTYGGATINYRCIAAAGCTGQLEPGVPSTAWRTYWEWASLYHIRTAIAAKTVYNDAAINCTNCDVIEAARLWIRKGYAPQASQYDNTAHDGGDIGAVPLAVSAVQVTIFGVSAGETTQTTATITWSTNVDADSQVEYGTTAAYGSTSALDSTLTKAHAVTLTNLTPGTTYYFRVKSKDAAGSLTVSPGSSFTTAAAPPVITAVSTGTPTQTTATITWSTNVDADSQVEYGMTTAYGSTSALDVTLTKAHAVTLISLTPGTTYYFRVKSKDAAGSLTVSPGSSFTTAAAPGDTLPPTITGVSSGTPSQTTATIVWTTDERSDSQVEYGTTLALGMTTSVTDGGASGKINHSVRLTGLLPGTLYYFRVLSRDRAGNRSASQPNTFTTAPKKR